MHAAPVRAGPDALEHDGLYQFRLFGCALFRRVLARSSTTSSTARGRGGGRSIRGGRSVCGGGGRGPCGPCICLHETLHAERPQTAQIRSVNASAAFSVNCFEFVATDLIPRTAHKKDGRRAGDEAGGPRQQRTGWREQQREQSPWDEVLRRVAPPPPSARVPRTDRGRATWAPSRRGRAAGPGRAEQPRVRRRSVRSDPARTLPRCPLPAAPLPRCPASRCCGDGALSPPRLRRRAGTAGWLAAAGKRAPQSP